MSESTSDTTPQRRSHFIRSRTASRFFKGAKHAQTHSRPFNLSVTVNLSLTECSERQASKAGTKIYQKFTRWLKYQSDKAELRGDVRYGAPTYGGVIEAPEGKHHLHWLVHVPVELEALFIAKVPVWVSKVCGKIEGRAIDIRPIETVMAFTRYCMKGVDPGHAKRCYVRPVPHGVVYGKRVTISRNLGPTARRKENGRGS